RVIPVPGVVHLAGSILPAPASLIVPAAPVPAAPVTRTPAPSGTERGPDQADEEEQEEEAAEEPEEAEAMAEAIAPPGVRPDRVSARGDDNVAVLGEAVGDPGVVGGDAESDGTADEKDDQEDLGDGSTVHGCVGSVSCSRPGRPVGLVDACWTRSCPGDVEEL